MARGGTAEGTAATPRRPLWTAIRILPAGGRGLLAVTATGTLVAGLLPVAFTLATGLVVARAVDAMRAGSMAGQAGRALWSAVAVLAAIFVVQQLLPSFRVLLVQLMGRRVEMHLRGRVMRAMLAPHGVAHLEDAATLDKASLVRGVGPTGYTPAIVVRGLDSLATQYIGMVGSAVILARRWWWLAAIMLVTHVVTRRILRDEIGLMLDVMVGEARAMRRANYFRDMILEPGAAKETRVFGLRAWILRRFGEHWHEGMREVWRARGERRIRFVAVCAALGAAYIGALLVVGRAAGLGQLDPGSITVFIGAIFGFAEFNLDGDLAIVNGTAAIPATEELERTLVPARATLGRDPGSMPERGIRFEGVGFRYPGGTTVYDGLDLEIPAGRSLAIVGPNGAGKTTLVKLLARLYEPASGRIEVDGVDLRELDPRAWQRRVAAIFQDFVQYKLSARDNVALGAPERSADDDAVAEAARRAGADGIVEALPGGWDTVLSRQYTGGADLSGGQWQRIALARALFAVEAGAGVLVLDEPTANLDVRAEAELFDRFLEITRGLTTVLISHRFSTVRRADRIVVLEGGRVTEQGTHDELVARGGTYAHMFKLQAARFVEEAAER